MSVRRTPSGTEARDTSIEPRGSEGHTANIVKAGNGPPVFCVPACLRGAKHSAIIELLGAPIDDVLIHPRVYLNASHEVFLVTLFITWVVTLIWHRDQAFEHPALPLIGSLNPCFGWDYPPASYIAMTLCSTNVFLTWRYSGLVQARLFLLSPSGRITHSQRFTRWSAVFLALSTNTWQLLWLIGPAEQSPGLDQDPKKRIWLTHTGLFFAYALALYLAQLGQYLDIAYSSSLRNEIQLKNRVFIGIYSFSLVVFIPAYLFDILMYKDGKPPALSPVITYAAVFLWLACLFGSQYLMPLGDPLHMEMTCESVDLEEENSQEDLGDEEVDEESQELLVVDDNSSQGS